MPRQTPQVVSPASLTPPLMSRRGRGSTDSQNDGSSNTPQARNTFMADKATPNSLNTASTKSSQKDRKDRQGSDVFSVRQAPAIRTLDSWFVQEPPASWMRGRSPLRSLSPDAPVISETARSISILGRPPSPEKCLKSLLADLRGSPSSLLSSRGPTSGSTAVATVTPPGPKSPRDGGVVICVRSPAVMSTSPSTPSGDSDGALVVRQAANALPESESARTLAGGSSSLGRSTKCRPPADATAFGSSAKSKQRGASRGMETFTRVAMEKTIKKATTGERDRGSDKIFKPEPDASVEDSTMPGAATSGDELAAPSVSSTSGRRIRGRPAKRRNSAPGNSGPTTSRTPLAPCRSHRVTDDFKESSYSSTAVLSGTEKTKADSTTTPSSGDTAAARTPISKTVAKKKRKSTRRPVDPSGPLVVGAGGGSGWRKKEQPGDGRKGSKAKQRSRKEERSGQLALKEEIDGESSVTSVKAGKIELKDGSVGKGDVRMVISKRHEMRAPVKMDVSEVAAEGGGISAPEGQIATPPKKRRTASLDEAEEAVMKKSCRREVDGEGDAGVTPSARRSDDVKTQKAVPRLAGAAAAALGIPSLTNAQASNESLATSAGAFLTPASQAAAHLGASPASAMPLHTGAVASTFTTANVSSTACDAGVKQEASEKLVEAALADATAATAKAATGGCVWTPPEIRGVSAAAMAMASQSEGEVEANLMVGDGKCKRS